MRSPPTAPRWLASAANGNLTERAIGMGTARSTFLTVAALAGFSACASLSDNCDPTTGGLLGAIGCDASGAYDQRLEARQSEQAALLKRQTELVQEQANLEAQRQVIAAELQAKQAEQAKAERELAAVRRQLRGAQAEKRTLQARARALEQQVVDSQHAVADLMQAESRRSTRIAELQRELSIVTKEYNAATGR